MASPFAICAECGLCKALACRGLCRACYDDLSVRQKHTAWKKIVDRDQREGDFNGVSKLPEAPVVATQGSMAKLLVMRQRAANRQALHHPEDATIEGRTPLAIETEKGRYGFHRGKKHGL